MKKMNLFGTALLAAFIVAAPVSLTWTPSTGPVMSTDTAQARIGRPLTPGSIAGVNRRVHRRAYRHGLYYGAGAAGAYGAYYYGRRAYCGYYPYPPCY